MLRSLYTSATGMEAQQLYMDGISNNLSNINTVGYKRSKIEFDDLMYQSIREPGVRNHEGNVAPSGIEVGLGVKPSATHRIFEQGSLNRTDNKLDFAIQGEGFFQVGLPDGRIAYTRDGQFKVSSEGELVTSNGRRVYPQITIPEGATELTVSAEGIVSVIPPGEETSVEIGQFELARFINPSGLKAEGENLYSETSASGIPVIHLPGEENTGTIMQGYTEASNVFVVDEMVNMIQAQRAFEIVSKSIQTSEDMLQIVNNLKR